jgi:hypothetical protein
VVTVAVVNSYTIAVMVFDDAVIVMRNRRLKHPQHTGSLPPIPTALLPPVL